MFILTMKKLLENIELGNIMCKDCNVVEKLFEEANVNLHSSLVKVHQELAQLIADNRLEIYAGDCKFKDMLKF